MFAVSALSTPLGGAAGPVTLKILQCLFFLRAIRNVMFRPNRSPEDNTLPNSLLCRLGLCTAVSRRQQCVVVGGTKAVWT